MKAKYDEACFDDLQWMIYKYGMETLLDCLPWFFQCSLDKSDLDTLEHLLKAKYSYTGRYNESEHSSSSD